MKNLKFYSVIAIAAALSFGLGYWINSTDDGVHNHESADNQADQDEIWTCSMHPQIQLSEPGQCPICGMDLIPAGQNKNANPNAVAFNQGEIKLNNIEVITINASSPEKTIKLDGKIKVNKNNTNSQSAHYGGRIEKLNVQYEGQLVKKGDLIAEIYAPELIKAQKELLEAVKLKTDQPLLYEAAKSKLKFWKISSEQIKQIESRNETIDYLPIYAERTGIVTKLKTETGSYVKAGAQLFELVNLSTVWIELDAYERDLKWLEVGQQADLSINTGKTQGYKGVITYIDPVINPQSQTAKVRIVLNNNGDLKPEMFVSGTVTVRKSAKKSLVIPKSAVMWTGEQSVYYREIAPNTFEMQTVIIGKDLGSYYEVLGGLNIGDRIVKTGTFVVDAAAQLQGKPSMMNQPRNNSSKAEKSVQKQLSNHILKLYLRSTQALQNNNEKELKTYLKEILDSLPELQTEHPHLLHHTGKELKSAFSRFSFALNQHFVFPQSTYLMKCPMANLDQGGFWLSKDTEVNNPYFGGEMLKCGAIEK